jgi:hypothetical protein
MLSLLQGPVIRSTRTGDAIMIVTGRRTRSTGMTNISAINDPWRRRKTEREKSIYVIVVVVVSTHTDLNNNNTHQLWNTSLIRA